MGLPFGINQTFPGSSAGKESTCNSGDSGLIPELGRSPGEGQGYPLQYSGLENSMDSIVTGVTKSQIHLSDSLSLSFTAKKRFVFHSGNVCRSVQFSRSVASDSLQSECAICWARC